MLSNYIGGGQVFLHKVRMLLQVLARSLHLALAAGILLGSLVHLGQIQKLDWVAFGSYQKAQMTISFDEGINSIRPFLGKKTDTKSFVDASTKHGKWASNIDPVRVVRAEVFRRADQQGFALFWSIAAWGSALVGGIFFLIFLLWSKFGRGLKTEKTKEGSGVVLTAEQVRSKLRSLGQCSDFSIGLMPLVKNMETRHFLVTGATGSGKTNLMHILLTQVEQKKQPAIVIDQTGEMIAKYYNKERGDIIFNPFDIRSSDWDFWADCKTPEDLETFAQILICFNSRKNNHSSGGNDFWESSATSIFVDCAKVCQARGILSVPELIAMIATSDNKQLEFLLQKTPSAKYFGKDNAKTVASMLSVLMTNIRPLRYIGDGDDHNSFSMKEHFKNIQDGSNAWLFLATKPSNRQLTLPLIATLTELAMMGLVNIGIDAGRKVWFVIDELPALGKLPSLPALMAEGRKYGACVLAGMQSLNQLYSGYGHYDGSAIFGQFGTSFFFRNSEPTIAKMVSSMSGTETITRQQKNTSFGANEFRDGVSYNEQEQRKNLIEADDLAALSCGQCYVLLPEPKVRLSKIMTKEVLLPAKQSGFIERTISAIDSKIASKEIKRNKQFKDESGSEENEAVIASPKTEENDLEMNQ
jgi:type IV conjugative transfer system coupling protein TraD